VTVLQIRELPDPLHRIGRINVHPNAMHSYGGGGIDIALGIVKKCRSMSLNSKPTQREFVDGVVGFAHTDFVAINNIIKNVGEIKHRPPGLPQFTDIVG
jgi:hypothetical protein